MTILLKTLLMVALLSGSKAALAVNSEECIVILHGLGRTQFSMRKIESRLLQEGYKVTNESYSSTDETITDLARLGVGSGVKYCAKQKARKLHFVTHSLGGILVRSYLQDHTIKNLGRIVMLAPPNKGSEVVDVLREYKVYNMAMGPAGQALGTAADSLPNQLEGIAGEIGVIAGNFSSDPWFSPLIPGDDDGKVSVEHTKLDEMKDFWVVDSGHTFIMRNDDVIEQVVFFLREGHFNPVVESQLTPTKE